MATKLEKSIWRPYFDSMSRFWPESAPRSKLPPRISVDQIEAEWAPLIGITYDQKNDLIEVALEGVDHLINRPHEVWVEAEGQNLSSIENRRCETAIGRSSRSRIR